MSPIAKRWIILGLVLFGSFMVLGFFGREVYRQAPPIPEKVVTSDGRVLMTEDDILTGQQVWQRMGGMQIGSIWGHGAYQAPDWSADWLHREATALLDIYSQKEYGQPFAGLEVEKQGGLKERLKREMRTNTFDPRTKTVTVSEARAAAMADTAKHYLALFGDDPALAGLRESYALQNNAAPDEAKRALMTHFFFWTAWACATERPGLGVTYTNNWPHEPLIGNQPTSANVLWSIVSIVLLIAGIGVLVWYKAFKEKHEEPPEPPKTDPLDGFALTPSMKAAAKYAVTVIALFILQALLGALTAHYTVQGDSFYGLPLADYIPYVVSRTWHIQLAVFWIATAFLAAGLFLAPAVGGQEPRFQRLGVNVLFVALVVVVLGSMAGEWASVKGFFGLDSGFWFGHQGYEYVDLGRAWQIALFTGLVLWLVLMLRALWPALKRRDNMRQIALLFAGSGAAIGLFYASGFFYGSRTHLTVMEYWRWWVVHLWVEGFMEVFATAVMAFIFTKLGLVRASSAISAALLSTAIFLVGGIPGTFHHLYFSGTPVSIMAVGATFSALEVVPLALIGFEAWETYKTSGRASWMEKYRWPTRFFLGVAFWNLVGAGLFGFMINPPVALYYMQGLNTTPVHGHAALFGVYGLLALGLVLIILRRLRPQEAWKEAPLRLAFWSMNIGLGLMIALSLLPIGLAQAAASIDTGLWYARSAEFLQQPVIEYLRWARFVGDTVFLVGVGALAYFVAGLKFGWSYVRQEKMLERKKLVEAAEAAR
ncbi:MAG: nitric-oxide reductase large subunit [Myxococcales bacterium]|nr:MAG: nitric-oxide reductase large subunit [Myxococcales bacterium]